MPHAEGTVTDHTRGVTARALRWLLAEPRLRNTDVDSRRFVELHRQILFEKPVMRAVFAEFYLAILDADARYFTAHGARVELGAGSSIFGVLYPEVISTDIKQLPSVKAVVDALAMPFNPGTVRAFYGINCFHHLPDPRRFFDELVETLPAGGGCILIEPYHGPLARQFYCRLFETEPFDMAQTDWTSEVTGPMTGANSALSYIVFRRDIAEFTRSYPQLEVVEQRPLTNYLRYILAGGLNFRTLIPAGLGDVVRAGEQVLAPAARWLALHHLIVLRRNAVRSDLRS